MNNAIHAPSWYAASQNLFLDFPALEGEQRADIGIIGGGFTGLNTAIELAERGFSVCLLEAHKIGWGASGRNGGQLIRGVGHNLDQFHKRLGEEGVKTLKTLGLQAVDIVSERIERFSIDCDLAWGYADLANTPRGFAELLHERDELEALGYRHPLHIVEAKDMAQVVDCNHYAGALIDAGSGHLHPLNLALGEAAAAASLGVRLHEQSPVEKIDYGNTLCVHTKTGQLRCTYLVLACNAYLGELEPQLAGKVLPAGSYVIATEPLNEELAKRLIPNNRALCDQRVALDYFRFSRDNRLLFGGACHYSGRDPKDIAAYMRPKMLKVFPELEAVNIDFAWGGMIGIGANRLPQIGKLRGQPNLWYAQAYAGHGLNATHLAARLLGEAISGQQSQGFDLFAQVPHMTFPGGRHLRSPLLALGMLWHQLKERWG
ncbi:FAD-dependent oxidoreductase [Ventosimonas gracilis]|uniref:FAD-dependent oxidoreductase n=1 Tax=Ventosimonas gracilis TaxID=1680762 RepID=A0A139SVV7_9GAMM|nr:FAD-binding oxidoreductase [Ventosimonas gracilis]KXU38571.1 FAD-dependent oxidoreductase [Ventosimonas gracilis]